MRWPACNGNCGNWKQQKQITLTSKNASKCHFQNISNHHGPEMSRMPSQKTECSGFEPNHFFLDNPQWNGKSWARRRPCWGLADPSGRVAKCEAKCWVMCAMQWCNGDSPTSLYKNMVVLVRIHDIHIYICYMYIRTWNRKILESQYSSPVGSLTEIFGVQKETHNRRCCIDFAGHRNWCYKLFRKTLPASSSRMKIGALKKDPFGHETHQSG